MKKLLLSTLLLLLTAPSFAQYNRATIETQQVVEGQAAVLSGKIYVCSGRVTRCGPDSTLATIYSNSGVSTTTTNPVTTSGSDGSYSYYLVYGDYTEGWYDSAGSFIAIVHAPAGSPCYDAAGILIGCTPASAGTLPATTGTVLAGLVSNAAGAAAWSPRTTSHFARNNQTSGTNGAYNSTVAMTASLVTVAQVTIAAGEVAPGGVVKINAKCLLTGTLTSGTAQLQAFSAVPLTATIASTVTAFNVVDLTLGSVIGDTSTTNYAGGILVTGSGSSPLGALANTNGINGTYMGSGGVINLNVNNGASAFANCDLSVVVINP